tara:strand:- start:289 stop:750 length:462 start_codon:yes stop_codon:yes gene_type:complete
LTPNTTTNTKKVFPRRRRRRHKKANKNRKKKERKKERSLFVFPKETKKFHCLGSQNLFLKEALESLFILCLFFPKNNKSFLVVIFFTPQKIQSEDEDEDEDEDEEEEEDEEDEETKNGRRRWQRTATTTGKRRGRRMRILRDCIAKTTRKRSF